MKNLLSILFLLAFWNTSFSQTFTQTIRGTITDVDSSLPLIGAEVVLLGTDPLMGTVTDIDGKFRIDNVVIGRVNLRISYLGYENKILSNLVVNSAKEVVLEVSMEESVVKMEEVVVMGSKVKGAANNEMALLSSRSISAEETNRYAGGFNDPSRILSNFAGVTNTQDGSNDIIVRGNAPKYVQWRLEGVQIANPNHFADQGGVSGSISTLNNNMLATSDFHTGAFTAEFGDVLSGVYDLKLRNGNNEKFEAVFGFGLLGTDLTLEGPFKKGYGGSYLVNYRYSTISMLNDLGIADIDGDLKFQDAAFKITLPTKKAGVFSLFGLGGKSSFFLEDITPALWDTPGDNSFQTEVSEDFDKSTQLFNSGINHTMPLTENSFLKTTLAVSSDKIQDEIFESKYALIYDGQDQFLRDSLLSRGVNYKNKLNKNTYRAAINYHNKLNAKHKIQVGAKYAFFDYNSAQSQLVGNPSTRFFLTDINEDLSSLRTFISWKYRINEDLTLVSGVHNMNVLYNKKSTVEPRLAMRWNLDDTKMLNVGYGKHSSIEGLHNYFAKTTSTDGSILEPNKDLDLLKAHHFVLGYEQRFGKNIRAKLEAYYQDLYNLPVENDPTSFYSTINEDLNLRFVDLVNSGTGKNYGIELTIERFFSRNFYYLINASLFESKYTALDGIERNTQFNGNYLVNVLLGKEFEGLGKKNNQTLGLNAKVFFAGGKKIIPLLRDNNGDLAVDLENNLYWDYDKAYESSLEDIYVIILSASYKWNRPKTTHELFLVLDNLTNTQGKISEFYDPSEPEKIGYLAQFGFFPNLQYKFYF